MSMPRNDKNYLSVILERMPQLVENMTIVTCIILGAAMVAVVTLGVITRYLMQSPLSWSEEVSRFLMNWMALLGASIAIRRRSHLGLLFFVSKMPFFLQRIIKMFSDSLILVFLYFLSSYGFRMVTAAKVQIEPTTGIPMNYPLLCVPLCGILAIIQLIFQMVLDAVSWRKSSSPFGL